MKNGFQKIAHYRKSWAIVIGINNYASTTEVPLDNAVNDAVELGNLLRDIGFEVRELYDENATKENITSLLADDLINEVEDTDRILIFFAGHAITKKNKGDKSNSGYIIPYDGTSSKISSLIEFDDLVRKTAKRLAAIHILFMLDCCFSGIAAASVTRSSREDSLPLIPSDKYIDLWMKKRALQIITAGEEDQDILDESTFFKGHSVFTGAILDGIESWKADINKDGILTASELGEYLKKVVSSVAYHQRRIQKPYVNSLYGHENGELSLHSLTSLRTLLLRAQGSI
ncbi:MAG: caspase domain-containing protein [Nitrososphaera sp.]